jgi:DsbC/DsbD-like thiol-disulfide interchange protein
MGLPVFLRPTLLALSAAFGLFTLAAGAAQAAQTPWQELGAGQVRLVAALDPATSRVTAVIDIELQEGWKTYWRDPGESGIPPLLDFAGSTGFFPGELRMPAPQRFSASGSVFSGYRDKVRFVFDGDADPARGDGVIRLQLLAGVCEEICIPATASFELPLARLMVSDAQSQAIVEQALAALPGEPHAGFGIVSALITEDGIADVQAELPDPQGEADLFVEGMDGKNRYFPPPELIARFDGKAVFSIDLSAYPELAAAPGAKLRFTLAQGDAAVEQILLLEDGR